MWCHRRRAEPERGLEDHLLPPPCLIAKRVREGKGPDPAPPSNHCWSPKCGDPGPHRPAMCFPLPSPPARVAFVPSLRSRLSLPVVSVANEFIRALVTKSTIPPFTCKELLLREGLG